MIKKIPEVFSFGFSSYLVFTFIPQGLQYILTISDDHLHTTYIYHICFKNSFHFCPHILGENPAVKSLVPDASILADIKTI